MKTINIHKLFNTSYNITIFIQNQLIKSYYAVCIHIYNNIIPSHHVHHHYHIYIYFNYSYIINTQPKSIMKIHTHTNIIHVTKLNLLLQRFLPNQYAIPQY